MQQEEVTCVAIDRRAPLDLVVRSVERSLPFYRDLLGPLGWYGIGEVEGERGETIWYLTGPGTSVGLRAAQPSQIGAGYDRYSVGMHHSPSRRIRGLGRRRAGGLAPRADAEIESGPQRVRVRPWLLRRVLLRPRRAETGDRSRPRLRRLREETLDVEHPTRAAPDAEPTPPPADRRHSLNPGAADRPT